jgi:hypothetical protein
MKFILNYLHALLVRWSSGVIAALDLIGLLVVLIGNIKIPSWIYFVIIGFEFIIANFIQYREDQLKFLELKEQTHKEIESLKAKILELEDRLPKLALVFKVGDEYLQKQTITVKDLPAQLDLDNMVKKEQARIAEVYNTRLSDKNRIVADSDKISDLTTSFTKFVAEFAGESIKDHEVYGKECENYLEKYKQYLVSKYNYDLNQARYRSVHFAVENRGRVPGEEIVIVTHFPDVFKFPSEQKNLREMLNLQGPPKSPVPPKTTTSIQDIIESANRPYNSSYLITPPNINISDINPRNISGPTITHRRSTEIQYEIKNLLHNFTEDSFERLGFIVSDEAIGKPWEIKYTIHAANLPVPVKGSLWIEVVKN